MPHDLESLELRLRDIAMAYPEAHEDFPWGERAIKVRGKTFLFLSRDPERVGLSMKLPVSREFALLWDFAEPTGYGLGRSGWVTCRIAPDTEVDLDLITGWIDESYRAVAPKRLAATLAPASASS